MTATAQMKFIDLINMRKEAKELFLKDQGFNEGFDFKKFEGNPPRYIYRVGHSASIKQRRNEGVRVVEPSSRTSRDLKSDNAQGLSLEPVDLVQARTELQGYLLRMDAASPFYFRRRGGGIDLITWTSSLLDVLLQALQNSGQNNGDVVIMMMDTSDFYSSAIYPASKAMAAAKIQGASDYPEKYFTLDTVGSNDDDYFATGVYQLTLNAFQVSRLLHLLPELDQYIGHGKHLPSLPKRLQEIREIYSEPKNVTVGETRDARNIVWACTAVDSAIRLPLFVALLSVRKRFRNDPIFLQEALKFSPVDGYPMHSVFQDIETEIPNVPELQEFGEMSQDILLGSIKIASMALTEHRKQGLGTVLDRLLGLDDTDSNKPLPNNVTPPPNVEEYHSSSEVEPDSDDDSVVSADSDHSILHERELEILPFLRPFHNKAKRNAANSRPRPIAITPVDHRPPPYIPSSRPIYQPPSVFPPASIPPPAPYRPIRSTSVPWTGPSPGMPMPPAPYRSNPPQPPMPMTMPMQGTPVPPRQIFPMPGPNIWPGPGPQLQQQQQQRPPTVTIVEERPVIKRERKERVRRVKNRSREREWVDVSEED